MQNKGQNLVEFLIILALIGLAGIMVLTVLGGNISAMLGFSKKQVAEFQPFDRGTAGTATAPTDPKTLPADIIDSKTVGAYQVDYLADGSASVEVNGQRVTIPASVLDLQNTVLETSGSAGADMLMEQVAYMIDEYKKANPSSDAPLEITFGTGSRKQFEEFYDGTASVNTAVLTVDNHVIIIQKDQGCTEGAGGVCDSPEIDLRSGTYIIEGDIVGNQFVSSKITNQGSTNTINSFEGTIENGVLKGVYDLKTASNDPGCPDCTGIETWDIDFSGTQTYNF